jgi:hypothetical protein
MTMVLFTSSVSDSAINNELKERCFLMKQTKTRYSFILKVMHLSMEGTGKKWIMLLTI